MSFEQSLETSGRRRARSQSYGIEYRANADTLFTVDYVAGLVRSDADDFRRRAISLGFRHAVPEQTDARARIEWRRDTGIIAGQDRAERAVAFTGLLNHKLGPEARAFAEITASRTTASDSFAGGTYVKASLGYAYRPLTHDRLNTLAKYTYIDDGTTVETDGTGAPKPRQKAHVLTLDASYDVTDRVTLSMRVARRLARSAAPGSHAFGRNDAWLNTYAARYHVNESWDALVEVRRLHLTSARITDTSVAAAVYRNIGATTKLGIGYNFGNFTDDLADFSMNNRGVFLNLVSAF